jgi:renalase
MTDEQPISNNNLVWDVLIVGAGIAGLSAATALSQSKLSQSQNKLKVCVVDKGRGVGGRMATRRSNADEHDFVWDHGAQFIRFRSEEGQGLSQKWIEQKHIFNWLNELPQWSNKEIQQHPENAARYSGLAGMTTIPKHLASIFIENDDATLICNYKVSSLGQIEINSERVWQLKPESGETLLGRSLALTAPLPQSIALLETVSNLSPIAYHPLTQIQYEPCLSLLIGLSEQPRQANSEQPILKDAIQFLDHPILGWIGNNQQKGISNNPAYTIQANGAWSREHFEEDETKIIDTLMEEVSSFIGFHPEQVLFKTLMKWRYSIPTQTYPEAFYQVPGELPLYLAGDAFETQVGAKRIEGSMLSGFAVARKISADLRN